MTEAIMPARTCRVASTPEEVLEAWTLVHDVYLANGHISPQPEGLYTTPSAFHPGTVVFNAHEGSRLVATLTAVPDSRFGLPPEDAGVVQEGFGREIASLREAGGPLLFCAQFVSAAALPDEPVELAPARFEQTFELFALLVRHVLHQPDLRILANPVPRHARYYARALGFERVGPVRAYGRSGVESVLLVTTLERMRNAPRLPRVLAVALSRPAGPAPHGVATSTLALPRVRRFIEAKWGSSAPVLALGAPEAWT